MGSTIDRLEKISSSTRNELQESRYGADGLRLRKIDSGALSNDPNDKVIVREDGLGIITSNVRPLSKHLSPGEPRKSPVRYMQGQVILGFQRDDSSYYFLADALGTIHDIVRDDRQIVQSYEYTEYGGLISQSTDFRSEKTFVGALSVQDDLPDSGLYLMGHRHYDPSLGRFISRDPIGFTGGLALYGYPNPVKYADPDGREAIITFVDGTSISVASGLGLSIAIKNACPGSIADLTIRSHGGTSDLGISSRNDADSIYYDWKNDRIVLQYDRKLIKRKEMKDGSFRTIVKDYTEEIDFVDLLKDKLAPGANINLHACSTGKGKDSIAQAISRHLTDWRVMAPTGGLDESRPVWGLGVKEQPYWYDSEWIYFKGGVETYPPANDYSRGGRTAVWFPAPSY